MIDTGTKNDPGCLNHSALAESEPATTPCSSSAGSEDDVFAFDMLEQSLGRESALEILHSFVGFAGESVNELRRAVHAGNLKKARGINRELSNSCHVIGAASVLRGCILLEEELAAQESGVADKPRLNAATAQLAAETKAVADRIDKLHQ